MHYKLTMMMIERTRMSSV